MIPHPTESSTESQDQAPARGAQVLKAKPDTTSEAPSVADPATGGRPAEAVSLTAAGRRSLSLPATVQPGPGPGHGNGNGNGSHGPPLSGSNGTFIAAISPGLAGSAAAGGNGNGNGNGHYHDSIAAAAVLLASAPVLQTAGRRPVPLASAEAWPAPMPAAPQGLYLRFGKRLLDLALASVGLILSGPILAVFAALIKLDSRGPILYRSIRLGRNGKPFVFFKLRSMYVGADRDRDQLNHLNEADGPVFKLAHDPRTTRIGRLIRRTSIDELPQFLNVLRGDMSMVGPRPPLPEEVEKYEGWHRRRLEVKPGITCLWQISGRSRIGFNEWMRLDLEYIKHQSLRTDLRILVRTIPAVLSREGAY